MADSESEGRVRELEQRMAAMPGSRIFVGLAEEYRRSGRYEDALNTLKKGLENHPTYLSAQIALARLYQETWRTQDAIDAFLNVLAMDRQNLVAAKALSQLYENSQNPVEAIKKLKLYRAISGDRTMDEKIEKMEARIGSAEAPPAPLATSLDDLSIPSGAAAPEFDPNETVSILGGVSKYEAPQPPVDSSSPQAGGNTETSEQREAGSAESAGSPVPREDDRATAEAPVAAAPAARAVEEIPPSRTLADLYYKQGFIEDARKIYEKLAAVNPMDESVSRKLTVLRKPSRRKSARLENWLAGIQSRARAARP
ncbi:MAG: tetratricopeptide repeat protein [Thermoanaerobaculia bacterium]